MTERDRLIELLKTPNKGEQLMQMGVDLHAYQGNCIEALIADFLLANGVIVPPCKVGQKVYVADKCRSHLGRKSRAESILARGNMAVGMCMTMTSAKPYFSRERKRKRRLRRRCAENE